MKIDNLLNIHRRLQVRFAEEGALIPKIYYCPDDIHERCLCRKPMPGMLHQAAHEHRLDLKASWMIGDSITDVKAGENASCNDVLLTSEIGGLSDFPSVPLFTKNLPAAIPLIQEASVVFVAQNQIINSRSIS